MATRRGRARTNNGSQYSQTACPSSARPLGFLSADRVGPLEGQGKGAERVCGERPMGDERCGLTSRLSPQAESVRSRPSMPMCSSTPPPNRRESLGALESFVRSNHSGKPGERRYLLALEVGSQLEFDKQVIIVTGGSSGIGRATAQAFAQEGGAVAIFDVATEAAEAIANELRGLGGKVAAHTVDICDAPSVIAAVDAVSAMWGRIDVLVNNAAISPIAAIDKMEEKMWDAVLNVNLKGVWLCSRAVIPHFRCIGEGCIINFASALAVRGAWGNAAYSASKAGVLGLTRQMAVELAPEHIRVNAVLPGSTDTPLMWGDLSPEERAKLKSQVISRLPAGRIAQPEEIARVVLFLASAKANFVTGATYQIDGGHLARSPVY